MNDFNGTTRPSWKAGIVALCLAACSPSGADSEVNGSAQSAGSGTGAIGGSHENPVDTGPRINIGGAGGSTSSEGGAPGSLGNGGVCNADSHEGQRLPLDMYFLVDS